MHKYIIDNKLTFYVRPNASKTKLVEYSEKKKALLVDLKAKPENNQANDELLRLVKKETGMNGKIIRGKTTKLKVVKLI